MKEAIGEWSHSKSPYSADQKSAILSEAKRRVALYENLIQRRHLVNGMVVNRSLDGKATSVCDSLLFSGLRYVALKKLGYVEAASAAWRSILNSVDTAGRFSRHPLCSDPISRDMILGLLVALSQTPPEIDHVLRELVDRVGNNEGFFSNGPMSMSYLTPGLAEATRKMSLARGFPAAGAVFPLNLGFSTIEFNSLYLTDGFRSHLVGLMIWLEIEEKQLYQRKGMVPGYKSPTFEISKALSAMTAVPIYNQRLEWVASKLMELNRKNLFYRWLYLAVAGGFSEATALSLLEELLSMPQFPRGSLPMDCDRGADYLWQREAVEYASVQLSCREEYSGVDFLWMAALLSEKIEQFQEVNTEIP